MDNAAFQNEQSSGAKSPPRRPLARANSTLSATGTRPWGLTQAARPQLCRCNSVLAPHPQPSACLETPDNNSDSPFFAKNSPTKNILVDNALWTKEFWSDTYNRLHDSSPAFQKFPSGTSGVSTIYDPQFLSSKLSYSGSQHSAESKPRKSEWWPRGLGLGAWARGTHAPANRAAAIFCALMLTLLATGNVLYILRTVEKPPEHLKKGTWVDVVLISGEFKITNEPYRLSLANHTSEDFQKLSSRISHQLDSLFALSVVSEPYHSTAVTQLLPGLLVRCQIVLRAATRLTATKVGLAFIGGLRNQHGHVWLGNFSVDIQSIGFQASGDAVSWTSWSEWGSCQHTQEFGFVQVRSRNCTLRSGQFLYSTLPCLLVPHSHGNIETAPCPTPDRDELDTAESAMVFSRTVNHTSRSEKIVNIVKVTRTNCTGNSTEHEEKVADSVITRTEQQIKNISLNVEVKGPCACANGEVCVAREQHDSPRCLPVLDPSDPTGCGGHCLLNTQLCQKLHDNAFRCVDDTQCLDDEWQCGNQLCIPESKRCDGHFNCYDHTDEFNCDCNLTSHFQCGNRMSCLPLTKRCDAIVDCWDATDELNCTIHCLGVDQFTCNDSQCIPNHRFCDGFADCNDHSDEPFGCGGECKTHEWKCRNSRCIPQSKRCDSVDDCGDDSDETECQTLAPE